MIFTLLLQDVIIRLERCQTLSYTGQSLLALAVIQYGDINKQGSYCNDLNHISVPTVAYKQAASIVLKQVLFIPSYPIITKYPTRLGIAGVKYRVCSLYLFFLFL